MPNNFDQLVDELLQSTSSIAEILFGKINPSGKLPYTYPRFPNALMTYDLKPMGFGSWKI